jgi:hypothetical protein
MDAFIVSSIVKKGLTSKKFRKTLEHAAFLINPPSSSNVNSNKNTNSNNTLFDNSLNDNSLNDNSIIADNSDTYKVSDNSDTIYSSTDNSRNLTINNIKVIKNKKNTDEVIEDEDEDEDYNNQDEYENKNKANKISNITFLLMLIINSYAAYLSWECNTHKNYPLLLKVVFSFFAFVFGTIYLLYYILFRFDACNHFSSSIRDLL